MDGEGARLNMYELADVLVIFPNNDAEQMSEVQNM
jgi:hypothetical protein